VLTDSRFNDFGVDARKIEDRPVVTEYEPNAIRTHRGRDYKKRHGLSSFIVNA
jgi:hypothetical protein